MKRLAVILILVFTATTLFAGGKECNTAKAAKSVELTGTLARADSSDDAKTVFRVANSDRSYTVCSQSKANVAKLSSEANATYKVKGKLVSCSEGEGQELVIESAQKI